MSDSIPPFRLALVAPPRATVPPSALGGLDMVRWLAEGVAARGHHVTLIGAGLHGFVPAAYEVIDTDPDQTAPADLAGGWHAKAAGEILAGLGVDAVLDHTRTGYRPAGRHHLPTAWTLYEPPPVPDGRPDLPDQIGLVAVSLHQQRPATRLPWWDVIHPGIPLDEHPWTAEHDGPCVYLGPLCADNRRVHWARLALDAAHAAGRPIVLAGTGPAPDDATTRTLVRLLGAGDTLRPAVSLAERWALLADAACLLALLPDDQPYSLAAVEALAAGTPVVGLYDTVVAELVHHEVSGVLCLHPRDLDRAVRAVGALDPEQVRRDAGRFDVAVTVRNYEALVHGRILAGAGR